jgi:hypothetical protein
MLSSSGKGPVAGSYGQSNKPADSIRTLGYCWVSKLLLTSQGASGTRGHTRSLKPAAILENPAVCSPVVTYMGRVSCNCESEFLAAHVKSIFCQCTSVCLSVSLSSLFSSPLSSQFQADGSESRQPVESTRATVSIDSGTKTFFVPVPPEVIPHQFCTPKFVGA